MVLTANSHSGKKNLQGPWRGTVTATGGWKLSRRVPGPALPLQSVA